MPNELTVIENGLKMVEPRLHSALGGLMPSNRLIQTVLISCERTPKLLECTPQSIMNGAMTFAVLGLPVDGATGQGFLLPFRKTAQAAIGYKGYNTLGARAGLTITGGTVREDDEVFDFMLGDKAFVRHKPKLGSRARIIAFWAVAAANGRPPIVSVLSIDEVNAIKAKSPAVKAGADTPWNDLAIGFPAMGEKSAKRRLARSTPLITDAPQFMLGDRMEEAFDEQGRPAWITPDRGVVLDGEFSPLPERNLEQPTAIELITPQRNPSLAAATAPASGSQADAGAFSSSPPRRAAEPAPGTSLPNAPQPGAGDIPSAEEYEQRWDGIIEAATSSVMVRSTWDSQQATRDAMDWPSEADRKRVTRKVSAALKFLEKCEAEKRAAEVDAAREGE